MNPEIKDTQVTEQLVGHYLIENPACRNLHMPTNDAYEITSPSGHFALKLYHASARIATEIQWEINLTLHLIKNGAPVAKPVSGKDGDYLQHFRIDNEDRVAVLFEWAPGEKPQPSEDTYTQLGKAAAQIHNAADDFTSELPREKYDVATLIDEQLERIKTSLEESGEWQRVRELTERLRKIITNPSLDWGVCHMDLTIDNVHKDGDMLTVFDLDSAAECWRAYEPYGALKVSEEYFEPWLEGYRSVREFNQDEQKAAAAFRILGDLRNTVWHLGFARSSRGAPSLKASDLPKVVDEWLEWEREQISLI